MGSAERSAPASDMRTLANAGGFGVNLNPAPKAFSIGEDKPITVITVKGRQRTFPAGCFNTGNVIPCGVKEFTPQTEAGAQSIVLYYD